MSITDETHRGSYEAVKPDMQKRRQAILEILSSGDMTANEIAEVLHEKGMTPFYERNFAAPRLTELKADGRVKTVGKKFCEKTKRMTAVWAIAKEETEFEQMQIF